MRGIWRIVSGGNMRRMRGDMADEAVWRTRGAGSDGTKGRAGASRMPRGTGRNRTAGRHRSTGTTGRYRPDGTERGTGTARTGGTFRLPAKLYLCNIFRSGSDHTGERKSSAQNRDTGYHPEYFSMQSLFRCADSGVLCRQLLHIHADEKTGVYQCHTCI